MLPQDVWFQIFSFVPIHELLLLNAVNRQFAGMLQQHGTLWNSLSHFSKNSKYEYLLEYCVGETSTEVQNHYYLYVCLKILSGDFTATIDMPKQIAPYKHHLTFVMQLEQECRVTSRKPHHQGEGFTVSYMAHLTLDDVHDNETTKPATMFVALRDALIWDGTITICNTSIGGLALFTSVTLVPVFFWDMWLAQQDVKASPFVADTANVYLLQYHK